ncbi:solute carrier family 13 member 1 isoform X2 [Pristis pectinata]|uniref:solute carrier family 13 member 1 isoform X2 n=1 Tax=Pristis pectinata TaxID=685728 RepID=UPI00223CA4C2|nr:solute carrier family 13 member 1 isoform X2 [Pristis pectinata]
MSFPRHIWYYRKLIIILFFPLLFLPLPLITKTKESECAFTMLVVAIYWLTEAMPLSVTALLPALMFPLFGIMKSSEVASVYFKDFHVLLIGVICLATSIEKWNLHKRIALRMVIIMGVNPGRLMMGFMLSCVFLSMWLSNTSTAAMVMPIVEAVLQQIMNAEAVTDVTQNTMNGFTNQALELHEKESVMKKLEEKGQIELECCKEEIVKEKENEQMKQKNKGMNGYCPDGDIQASKVEPDEAMKEEAVSKYKSEKDHNLCKGMCLCIAYSSTIGGLTTITGTSTNLIFAEQFNMHYPECHCINFGSWFILVLPMTVIIMVLSWVWLHIIYFGFNFSKALEFRKEKSNREKASIKLIEEAYKKLGPMGYKGFATDSTVALLLGILFFILPAENPASVLKKRGEKEYTTLITWKEFQSCMPWEISLLVGGGFALAKGSEVSGLSLWVGSKLEPLGTLPVWVIVLVSCLIVTSVTEVASNPATITIFLPILVALSEATHINPLYLLIPSTLCTSFAFLLPVSNPPNAIVFGYGHLTVMDMVKAGLGVNIIGIVVVMIAISTWAIPLFDLKTYPSWAQDLRNATIP